jgi:hypothetical protein
LSYAQLFDQQAALNEVIEVLTLTKAAMWSYEREWRIVTTLRNKTQTYEIISFAREEVGAVYLGCKISPQDRDDIIEITRRKYAGAKIFQAEKHRSEFALVFREL